MCTMNALHNFFARVFASLSALPFPTLVFSAVIVFCSLAVLFILAMALSERVRGMNKRCVLSFVNCFTALFLALLLIGEEVSSAIFWAAIFWLAGYLYYGIVCAFTKGVRRSANSAVPTFSALPQSQPERRRVTAPAAEGTVKLDHAISMADRLLLKPLSRADRQELERIKTPLTVMQIKGSVSPQEGEALNSCFSALLKLTAKYSA